MAEQLRVNNRDTILKAQKGDMFAFHALVDLYREQAVRIAYSVTGNLADAQDVTQDAFIRVYRNIKAFNFNSQFSTWLYRIVVNLCRDFLRKKGRSRLVLDDNNHSQPIEARAKDEKSLNPSKNLLNKEIKAKIDNALLLLPQKQQLVFSLKYKNDMKIREIAQLMGISVSTVKMHLFRATDKMQKNLGSFVR